MADKRPRVFVVQAPARRDGPRGGWIEKFDLEPAGAYGELVRVIPYGNLPRDLSGARKRLEDAMEGYDFDRDFLLLLGDPVAIALAVNVVSGKQVGTRAYSRIRCLKWDRREARYEVYEV